MSPVAGPQHPVRDDAATTTCPVCGQHFEPQGRALYCTTVCRQTAWRRRNAAPAQPLVAKPAVVYACPNCDARYLGVQRCEDCNIWCRRVGPGAPCPCCDEPISVTELLSPEQFAPMLNTKPRR